ncbi:MAG: hypothetical protein ACFFBP_16615 [Promethearchaeota archaeon]
MRKRKFDYVDYILISLIPFEFGFLISGDILYTFSINPILGQILLALSGGLFFFQIVQAIVGSIRTGEKIYIGRHDIKYLTYYVQLIVFSLLAFGTAFLFIVFLFNLTFSNLILFGVLCSNFFIFSFLAVIGLERHRVNKLKKEPISKAHRRQYSK